MDNDSHENTPDNEESEPSEGIPKRVVQALNQALVASPYDSLATWALLVNFFIFFMRPQTVVPILGFIRLPLIVVIICLLLWLPRYTQGWTGQTKAILAFIIFEGLMGFIGKTVFDGLIVNDFWHFHTWRDLFQQSISLIFPLVTFIACGALVRRTVGACMIVGSAMGLYSITHAGQGPTGWAGDENDMCYALLLFLPFSLYAVINGKKIIPRFFALISLGLIGAGIIFTNSRGGFIGLLCGLIYFFIKSPSKLKTVAFGFVMLLAAIPFVPQEYWQEMSTIKETDQGTAKTRLRFWGTAVRMWLDPTNFLTGVGMENVRFRIRDYEPVDNLRPTGRSDAGRSVHSIWFQTIGDLGLVGILLLLYLIFVTYKKNNEVLAQILSTQKQLGWLTQKYQREKRKSEALEYLQALEPEMKRLITYFTSASMAGVGMLGAGTFISVLYYPPLWFLVAFCASLQAYWDKLYIPIRELLEIASETPRAVESEEV